MNKNYCKKYFLRDKVFFNSTVPQKSLRPTLSELTQKNKFVHSLIFLETVLCPVRIYRRIDVDFRYKRDRSSLFNVTLRVNAL